jgi:SGNH domain (fused to AT3 domains)
MSFLATNQLLCCSREQKSVTAHLVALDRRAVLFIPSNVSGVYFLYFSPHEKRIEANKTVWIVGPLPEASVRVPEALYIKHIGGDTTDIDIPTASFSKRNATILSIFAGGAKKYPIRFIWLQEVLCNDTVCPV